MEDKLIVAVSAHPVQHDNPLYNYTDAVKKNANLLGVTEF